MLTINITSVVNPGNVNNAAVADTDNFKFTYQVTVDYDPTNIQDGTQLVNSLDASAVNGGGGFLTDINNTTPSAIEVSAGTIIIAKASVPTGGTGFGFDSSDSNFPAAVANSFTLNDTQTKTIAHLPVPLGYDVIEDDPTISPGNFALTNIVCTGDLGGGIASSVDIPNRKATINLDAGETVTCTFTNFMGADLALDKTGPASAAAGENITYDLEVTNNGPSAATGVSATDTLPANTTFVSSADGCAESAGTVTCNIGNLASGAMTTKSFTLKVADTAPAGNISNSASVPGNEADTPTANNSDSVTTSVSRQVSLAMSKTDSADPVLLGNNFTYTVSVTNDGPSTATNVTVSDTLPAQVNLVSVSSSQGGCAALPCNLGTLTVGQMGTVTITVTAVTEGTFTNTATVAVDETNNGNGVSTCLDRTLYIVVGPRTPSHELTVRHRIDLYGVLKQALEQQSTRP